MWYNDDISSADRSPVYEQLLCLRFNIASQQQPASPCLDLQHAG
jgi:hypothetical protein